MSSVEQRRLAGQYQAEQRATTSTLTRDLVTLLMAILGLDNPESSWPALRTALKALIRDRRSQSARTAGLYYRRAREDAGVSSPLTLVSPRDLVEERLDAALDGAGIAVVKRSVRLGATMAEARDRAAVTLSGTSSRLVLEGGRDVIEGTVLDDEDALGWARIGDGDPCAWCAMLISRGGVYKSAQTAGDARQGGERYHDHDGCQAVPIFDLTSPYEHAAEELYEQWQRVTAGHSGEAARQEWRRYWDARNDPEAGEADQLAALSP
jgi:hypothetical protein